MNTAVIGFGSNINPEINISKAKTLLKKDAHIIRESTFVKTKPIGYPDQEDFINGAVLIETEHTHDQLKSQLKSIESFLGRTVSVQKYGPRTIDLDILVWNNAIMSDDFFTRDFVKKAVLELLPALG